MEGRRNQVTIHFYAIVIVSVCFAGLIQAQNETTIDGDNDGQTIMRRADGVSSTFSGDAEFEARRPRGFLAALFGYPGEYETVQSSSSGSSDQSDKNSKGSLGGTPPPQFKANHYNITKKSIYNNPKLATFPSTKLLNFDSTDNLNNVSKLSDINVVESRQANLQNSTKIQNENRTLQSDEETSANNKREVTMSKQMRQQGRPLPAGYILWHPVPASFLSGMEGGQGERDSIPSDTMISGSQNRPFIPHRPFFVEPNMHGAAQFPMTGSSPNHPAHQQSPIDNKEATKLHRHIEKEQKRSSKKQRFEGNQQLVDEHDRRLNQGPSPMHMMLPPLPMNGFPDSPFHVPGQFEQDQRPMQSQQFNRDFHQLHQRPFPEEPQMHKFRGHMSFPNEPQMDKRPLPPIRPLENFNFENNNGPLDNRDMQGPQFHQRPTPSPSAHPVKFEIARQQNTEQRHRQMEQSFHRSQLPPLPPPGRPHFPSSPSDQPQFLPPPPGPHFPSGQFLPPHFPKPFHDNRPLPELPPPPPPPPLGPPRHFDENDHQFRVSSSSPPPPQHLDAPSSPQYGGSSNRPPMYDARNNHERFGQTPSDFRSPLQQQSSLQPNNVDVPYSPSRIQSGSSSVAFNEPTRPPPDFTNGNPDPFSGPPPLSTPVATNNGLNQKNNDGLIYSRNFKKALAEANIVLPQQEPQKIMSRSTSTTELPTSTFGLPQTMITNIRQSTTPIPTPHRSPRPLIHDELNPQRQQQQQPFSQDTEQLHPHQVSPAASHRLPQPNQHPNLPDFHPFTPTTSPTPSIEVDTNFDLQRQQSVEVRTSTPPPSQSPSLNVPTPSIDKDNNENYKSPGFHTGHKGYPSSVTAPNHVSSSDDRIMFARTRASSTIKSNLQANPQPSSNTEPPFGYVRHSQTSRTQPSASFSYEIKYQSPPPPPITSKHQQSPSKKPTNLTQNRQESTTSSTSTYRTPSRRLRTGKPNRDPLTEQPDIV